MNTQSLTMTRRPALLSAVVHSAVPIQRSRVAIIDKRKGEIVNKLSDIGLPSNHLIAPADRRYVNKYYYDAATRCWLLVAECHHEGGVNYWTLHEVDQLDGCPTGPVRVQHTDLWANRFADHPFDVNVPVEESVWFRAMVLQSAFSNRKRSDDIESLYAAYLERRKISSSYEALVRVGLREPA